MRSLPTCLTPGLVALALMLPAQQALAGPNAGGTLILHANPTIAFTTDDASYCGTSPLSSCELALTSVDTAAPVVFFVLAAFPENSHPRLRGASFGIQYPQNGFDVLGSGRCADFDLPTDDWPNSGSGVGISFSMARTSQLVEIYWISAQLADPDLPAVFALSGHPTQGANFGDDSVPSLLDPIAGLGSLGFGQSGYLPCPEPLVPTGACCFDDGHCMVVSESDCAAEGGNYFGNDTDCSPNPCPQPPAACCFSDGHCEVLFPATCTQLGGTSLIGINTCDPNPCPEPAGACCAADGSCIVTTETFCGNNGGLFMGSGTDCTPNPCTQPPRGACCFPSGTCVVLTPAECTAQAGIYEGHDTVCDPNPCAQPPSGACCLDDGRCVMRYSFECSGAYQGDFTSCDPSPCPPGGCCLETGGCALLAYDTCLAGNGQFLGVGSDCTVANCPVAGACCFPSGDCASIVELSCLELGGDYQGDGAACDPNPCPQPCPDGARVNRENAPFPKPIATPPTQTVMSGPNWGTLILHGNPDIVYTDDGSSYCGQSNLESCNDAVLSIEGDGPVVIHALAAFRVSTAPRLKGITFGIEYGNCLVIDAWGACSDFELATGDWPASGQGTALTWNEVQTGQLTEVYWFACYVEGHTIDRLKTAPHPNQGGNFSDDSIPARLDPIRGYGVFGFNRLGFISCPPNAPLYGACCFEDGSCSVTTPEECFGTYYGDGTDCSPNPCQGAPLGACCVYDECYQLTGADCEQLGGLFIGDGVGCEPNPCGAPVPTRSTTWGWIKARYAK